MHAYCTLFVVADTDRASGPHDGHQSANNREVEEGEEREKLDVQVGKLELCGQDHR